MLITGNAADGSRRTRCQGIEGGKSIAVGVNARIDYHSKLNELGAKHEVGCRFS